jgi:hypothetical protein
VTDDAPASLAEICFDAAGGDAALALCLALRAYQLEAEGHDLCVSFEGEPVPLSARERLRTADREAALAWWRASLAARRLREALVA